MFAYFKSKARVLAVTLLSEPDPLSRTSTSLSFIRIDRAIVHFESIAEAEQLVKDLSNKAILPGVGVGATVRRLRVLSCCEFWMRRSSVSGWDRPTSPGTFAW